ncbi:hypothetical protein B0H14DRAFT_2632363 [Mycena olivaceomarginata]|nr:hypothetical protein B0H14DRAFT_2632363 [Mycena olivaceomarginata]
MIPAVTVNAHGPTFDMWIPSLMRDLELFDAESAHPVGPTTQQTRVLELLIAFRHNWEGGLPDAFNRLNSIWEHLTGNNNLKKLEDKNQKSPKKAEVVLSMRNNKNFRHIAVLVLGDLDQATAPTAVELYGVLLEANWPEALSLGKLGRTGGNEAFNRLLELLRVPSLDMLDVRVMDARDCRSLLGCAELVRPVRALRIYGAFNSDLDLLALSILMPDVAVLDVTMADRALARWYLRIHYPFPAKML